MSTSNYGQLTREQLKTASLALRYGMGTLTMLYPPRRTKKGVITREGAAIVRKVCVMYSGAVEAEFYTDEDADTYILSTMQLEEP